MIEVDNYQALVGTTCAPARTDKRKFFYENDLSARLLTSINNEYWKMKDEKWTIKNDGQAPKQVRKAHKIVVELWELFFPLNIK